MAICAALQRRHVAQPTVLSDIGLSSILCTCADNATYLTENGQWSIAVGLPYEHQREVVGGPKLHTSCILYDSNQA